MDRRGRRQFLRGGLALASPGLLSGCGVLPPQAQPTARVPRVGFLGAASPSASRVEALRQGLRELGYVEGENVAIEYRYAEGNLDRLSELAAELVRLEVDIIVTGAPSSTRAARAATSTIPIVMAYDTDPVANGFVASLARPGGNITGLSSLAPGISGKQLELLKEIVPGLSRTAVLGTSALPTYVQLSKEVELAARALRNYLRPSGREPPDRPQGVDRSYAEGSTARARESSESSGGVMNDQLRPEHAASREGQPRPAPVPVGLSVRLMRPEDAEVCEQVGFEAHGAVAAANNVPSEQPTLEFAVGLIRALQADPAAHRFVAERDGRVVGSVFLHTYAAVAVIGPLTVHPEAQGGAGRRLMEVAPEEARRRGIAGVRLVQSPAHLGSLALYVKMGFEVREPLVLMQGDLPTTEPGAAPVRPATERDILACNALCRRVHGLEREHELRQRSGRASRGWPNGVAGSSGTPRASASSDRPWPRRRMTSRP